MFTKLVVGLKKLKDIHFKKVSRKLENEKIGRNQKFLVSGGGHLEGSVGRPETHF